MINSTPGANLPAPSPAIDLWLPRDVFAPLQRIVRAAQKYYAEIDPSILLIDERRLKEIGNILDNAEGDKQGGYNLRLTNIDMIDFEKLSFYAEEFFADLGGAEALQMTPPDITALTEKLRRYRNAACPESAAPL